MKKKSIITIAGHLGSGKSSASEGVARILDYAKKSTGDFMRSIAKEKGITLQELSSVAETDTSIDKMLDDSNIEIGKMENIVLDSRLGFHFIPGSFKVFLICDPLIAAKRILKDRQSNPNRHNESLEEFDTVDYIASSITKRLESERKRYFDLYQINDHTNSENFDLIIDTTLPENTKEHVPEIIVDEYNKWLAI